MKITSDHKKFYLPLLGMTICFFVYIKTMGSWIPIVMPLPFAGFLVVFLMFNGERIGRAVKAWLNRDGWK